MVVCKLQFFFLRFLYIYILFEIRKLVKIVYISADWAAILMLASRQADGEHMLRVMVKDVIRFAPLFGWYIYQV